MGELTYYPSKVRTWLEVEADDDLLEIPIASGHIVHALNSLPMAEVTLAVGVDAANTGQRAGAHLLPQDLKRGLKAKIWCALEGVAGPLNGKVVKWPGLSQGFCVFEGKVSTAGARMTPGGLSAQVGLTSWMAELDKTCWMTSAFPIGTPEFVYRLAGQAGGNIPSMAIPDAKICTEAQMFEDLWLRALLPALKRLANGDEAILTPLFKQAEFLGKLYGDDYFPPNSNALIALNKLSNSAMVVVPELQLLKGAQANLQADAAVAGIAGLFALSINDLLWSTEGSTGLWSKLLRIFGHCLLAISPSAQTASIVPLLPTLDKTWVDLDASEIFDMSVNTIIVRDYRGVALLPHPQSLANFAPGQSYAEAVGAGQVAGFYDIGIDPNIPNDLIGSSPGMLKIEQAPAWMNWGFFQDASDYAPYVSTSYMVRKQNADRATRLKAVAGMTRRLGDEIAKLRFMQEVFKSRGGGIATRLRFDIAPGSTIGFKGTRPDLAVPGFTPDGAAALVARVVISLSSNPAHCGTNLDFMHMRLAHELPFSMSEHPLFGTYWRGSPLVNIPGCTPPLVK